MTTRYYDPKSVMVTINGKVVGTTDMDGVCNMFAPDRIDKQKEHTTLSCSFTATPVNTKEFDKFIRDTNKAMAKSMGITPEMLGIFINKSRRSMPFKSFVRRVLK